MTDERDATPPPRADVRSTLSRLADSGLALLRTRGELAAVELTEELGRLKRTALTLAVAVVMLAFALGGVGVWIVVYFWDTARLTAIALVTLAYALLAFALWRADAARSASAGAPFAATLAELEKDREWLARRARGTPPTEP